LNEREARSVKDAKNEREYEKVISEKWETKNDTVQEAKNLIADGMSKVGEVAKGAVDKTKEFIAKF
jgi:hypothetical protein